MKRSMMVEARGIPLGRVLAGANRHDSPLLEPTLGRLDDLGPLPDDITVHLDACETIRDNAAASKASASARASAGPTPNASPKPADMAEYLRWRKAFADSRHEDLRVAGVEVMDLINQMSGAKEDDGLAFMLVGQLVQKWGALAGACANHGVTIPKITEMSN